MKKFIVICMALVCLCFSGCGMVEETKGYTREELEALPNYEIIDILEDIASDEIGSKVDYVYQYIDENMNIHCMTYVDGVLLSFEDYNSRDEVIGTILEYMGCDEVEEDISKQEN